MSIRLIELRRWAGHVARIGEKITAYDIVVEKPEGEEKTRKTKASEGVSKSFRSQPITKLTTTNTCWEATRRVMSSKLTRLTHKTVIQLHLVAESCTICSQSGNVWIHPHMFFQNMYGQTLHSTALFHGSESAWCCEHQSAHAYFHHNMQLDQMNQL